MQPHRLTARRITTSRLRVAIPTPARKPVLALRQITPSILRHPAKAYRSQQARTITVAEGQILRSRELRAITSLSSAPQEVRARFRAPRPATPPLLRCKAIT